MLVITSTEGMLHWILGHTANLGPAITLHGVLVVGAARLEQRLVGTPSAGHDADLRTYLGGDGLLTARG